MFSLSSPAKMRFWYRRPLIWLTIPIGLMALWMSQSLWFDRPTNLYLDGRSFIDNLQTVRLDKNSLIDGDTKYLEASFSKRGNDLHTILESTPKLRWLSIRDDVLKTIRWDDLPCRDTLECLNIRSGKLDAAILSKLTALPNLTTLHLDQQMIVGSLAPLSENSSLRTLSIDLKTSRRWSGNVSDGSSSLNILELSKIKQLRHLIIQNDQEFSDSTIEKFNSLPSSNFQHLAKLQVGSGLGRESHDQLAELQRRYDRTRVSLASIQLSPFYQSLFGGFLYAVVIAILTQHFCGLMSLPQSRIVPEMRRHAIGVYLTIVSLVTAVMIFWPDRPGVHVIAASAMFIFIAAMTIWFVHGMLIGAAGERRWLIWIPIACGLGLQNMSLLLPRFPEAGTWLNAALAGVHTPWLVGWIAIALFIVACVVRDATRCDRIDANFSLPPMLTLSQAKSRLQTIQLMRPAGGRLARYRLARSGRMARYRQRANQQSWIDKILRWDLLAPITIRQRFIGITVVIAISSLYLFSFAQTIAIVFAYPFAIAIIASAWQNGPSASDIAARAMLPVGRSELVRQHFALQLYDIFLHVVATVTIVLFMRWWATGLIMSPAMIAMVYMATIPFVLFIVAMLQFSLITVSTLGRIAILLFASLAGIGIGAIVYFSQDGGKLVNGTFAILSLTLATVIATAACQQAYDAWQRASWGQIARSNDG